MTNNKTSFFAHIKLILAPPNKTWETPEMEYHSAYRYIIENTGHIAIAGATGSGKSVLIRELIRYLLHSSPTKTNLILIDPKRVDLVKYKKLPHCIFYANDDLRAKYAIDFAICKMRQRYRKMERAGMEQWNGSDIFVFVDECADLLSGEYAKEIKKYLIEIARLGRAAKVRLIMATQAPSRKTLPAEIIQNCDRIALRCFDAIESRQILGTKGAESLPPYGRGILRVKSNLFGFDVDMTDQEDHQRIIDHWINQK